MTLKKELSELVNLKSPDGNDVRIYEMLKEQNFRCIYCDNSLPPDAIISSGVQEDHIYPRSRSHEDGYVNKIITCITCNQNKRNQTPWQWKGESDPEWWSQFSARVEGLTFGKDKEKKRRLLSKSFKEREQHFIERNKVDNSYTSRALLRELRKLYPESYRGGTNLYGGHRHVFPRPGTLTEMLRRAWLSKWYRKDRKDDRHHAMDALIVGLISEGMLQRLTMEYQRLERLGKQHEATPPVAPPWESFAEDAKAAFNAGWLVCRTENRRARGALHEETIRRARIDDDGNQKFFQRKSIHAITKSDIEDIPDRVIRERVAEWFDQGKPEEEDALPRSAKGDPIRKLRLPTKIKTATQINREHMGGKDGRKQGGYAQNSGMVRVDLFKVSKTRTDSADREIKPGYYLVPIYRWQVGDKNQKTPLNAIVASKPESEWPRMRPEDFVMSLYKDSYIELTRKDGETKKGYYRRTNRSTAAIGLSEHHQRGKIEDGIGVKSLANISKFQIDRLGIKHEISLSSERWPGLQYDK